MYSVVLQCWHWACKLKSLGNLTATNSAVAAKEGAKPKESKHFHRIFCKNIYVKQTYFLKPQLKHSTICGQKLPSNQIDMPIIFHHSNALKLNVLRCPSTHCLSFECN